jgi:hypothetical protein
MLQHLTNPPNTAAKKLQILQWSQCTELQEIVEAIFFLYLTFLVLCEGNKTVRYT